MKTINREILRLAWPAIATNVTTPLLSLVDIAIVGHIGSVGAIGAVAVGGTMFSILYFLFAFLRMGTSGLTAQAYGAQDTNGKRLVFKRGLIIALVGGVLLILLSEILGDGVLALIEADENVKPLAKIYFLTAIIGAPGVLTTNVVSGWLLGMQKSRPIMWIALATNLLNVTLSCVLVFGFNLGVRGVALGTASAQLTGALIGLLTVRHFYPQRDPDRPTRRRGVWRQFFSLNSDIFLRTLCLSAVTLWFTHSGARMGADVLAANSLLLQLFLVFSYFMDGFAFAGEALAGKFYGARDFIQLKETIKALIRWGVIMATGCSILYFLGGQTFLEFLTDSKEVLAATQEYILWAVSVPFAGFLAFIWDGVFIGLTRSRWMLWSMFSAMIVYFAIYFLLYGHLGNHALWLAFVIYLAVRGVVAHFLYKSNESRLAKF
ncbi:MAG: MATE family efflux transporter [Bacteroidales bacterium]|nr:MATE family efflux transporter [Bacteroidales bacterium]